MCQAMRRDLDQRLRLADHPHDRAVIEHQPVAVPQHGGPRQVEQEPRAGLAGHDQTTAVAVVGAQDDAIDEAARVPVAAFPDVEGAFHRRQNRKYRCAIGSVSAGAQVKSSPSARTS
jgi:hypothetical protein